MKAKEIKTASIETLKTELGTLQSNYNRHSIEFKNSKKEKIVLPYNRIDRNGQFIGDRATETEVYNTFMSCFWRARHEAEKQEAKASVTVGLTGSHSVKKGMLALTTKAKGLDAAESEVGCQMVHARSLAAQIHKIQVELQDRENSVAKVALDKAVMEALLGVPTPAAPVQAPAALELVA